jgi:TonB-linked SusC/RagA family outer membrane protein
MTRILSLFVVFMLTGALAFSQNRVVTGKVTTADGTVIPFATVSVQGNKTVTTVADANGNFDIKTKTGDLLNISGSGIKSMQTTVGSSNNITIIAERGANTELESVVVTGLGVKRQAKELGYATAKVGAKELTAGKTVNLQNGLTGKVSGLNVITTNSGVFADTRINLRGIRSLTGNNQPMLVLDGVPIALSYLSTINPNDILDVVILKDATSTAIYGPDGANGAIVITSRKGVKGQSSITLSHTTQFETVAYMPRLQTQFGSGSSEDANGVGVYDPIENQTYGDPFDGSLREIGRPDANGNYKRVTYEARPNEKKRFWNTGLTNQTDLSFAAGDFYMSAQHVNIKGIMPSDENKRTSLSLNSAKEFGKLKASFSMRYVLGNYNVNASTLFPGVSAVYDDLIESPIQIPITDFKNWRTDYFSNPSNYFNEYLDNPYWNAESHRQAGRSDDILGNIELNYKVASWLNLTYRLGTTASSSSAKATQEAFTFSQFAKASGKGNAQNDINAAIQDQSFTSSRVNSELFATTQKEFGKFNMNLLVGHSFRESKQKFVSLGSNNIGIPEVYNISVRKGEPQVSENNSTTRLQRVFGKLGLGFNKWLFGEVTGSYDTDSRLSNPYDHSNSKISFFYPGASLSVVLTEAIPSIKSDVLTFAKIRGAASKTGNVNLGAYSLENTYSQNNGFPYGSLLGFTANDVLRRTSYEPEFVITNNVGIELGFWKNRINFEANVYQQKNQNQIITVAYSGATGYPSALLNAADFTNKGFELDLKLTPLVKIRNVSIDFKINYTKQTNKVNKLVDGVDELGIGNGNFIIKGESAYKFKLTDYVRDTEGRVIVDANGYPSIDPSPKVFGNTLPTDLLGMSLNVNWKSISLSVVADHRNGNQIYSQIGTTLDFAGASYRSAQYGRRPFVFPNSSYDDGTGKFVANTDRYTKSGGYGFWSQSINRGANSNYITSAAFWKLREVALTYTFPSQLFAGKGIKGANFSITGRNLLTWLPSTNQWTDPEFSNTTGNAQGVNTLGNAPPTRVFGANLTLTF